MVEKAETTQPNDLDLLEVVGILTIAVLGLVPVIATRSQVVLESYFYCQLCLLGVGSGVGLLSMSLRWIFVGLLCIELRMTTDVRLDTEAVVVLVLLPVFWMGVGCRVFYAWRRIVPVRIDLSQLKLQEEPLQFTVWHLMAITASVAVFFELTRWGLRTNSELVLFAVWYSLQLVITWTCAWSLLGIGDVGRRVSVFTVVAVAVGVLCEFLLDGPLFRHLTWVVVWEVTMLIAFLSVVRWAGWRLVPSDSVVAVGEREGATADERAMQGIEMQGIEMQGIERISAAALSDELR